MSRFELTIHGSTLTFRESLLAFFVKFANQNFPSVRISVFRETTEFLFTPQARQFVYILLQKVLNWTIFACDWVVFWPQSPNGGDYNTPSYPLAVATTHYIFADHFWKDNSNPELFPI